MAQKKVSYILTFACVAAIVCSMLAVPHVVDAARIYLSPASGKYGINQAFSTAIVVESASESINAVSGNLSFPADKFEILSLSKDGSIVNFWIKEPSFSNATGVIYFEGVVLNPGFRGAAGTVLTLRVRPKVAGAGTFTFSNASVLANDGTGTNVTSSIGQGTYTVTGAAPLTPPPAAQKDTKKPAYFTIKVVEREDKTDPYVELLFNAHDDETGIAYYEVWVDGEFSEKWNDDGSHVYKTKALLPGEREILAKAFDRGGNYLADTVTVTVDPLGAPRITYYKSTIVSGEPVLIQGEACGTAENISVTVTDEAKNVKTFSVPCTKGTFTFVSPERFADGLYTVSIRSIDARGAESAPTEPIGITIAPSSFLLVGGKIIQILAVIIPLLACIVFGWLIVLRAHRWIRTFKSSVTKEAGDVAGVVEKWFSVLEDDVKRHIHLLKNTSQNRALTPEENHIMIELEDNLVKARKNILKEVGDISALGDARGDTHTNDTKK